jgi:lipoprotein signal peptidase
MPVKKDRGLVVGVGVIVFLDQLSKYWADRLGIVVKNPGGIWGLAPGYGWTILMIGVIMGMGWFIRRNRTSGIAHGGWVIILGSGIGNGIDRVIYGAVRDFIFYPGLNFYGNGADIMLGIGVGMVILGSLKKKGNH